MGQQTLDGTDLTTLRSRYLTLINEQLPAAARRHPSWPIRQDHCFARVVLDTVFQDEWYNHVDGRPAYNHLTADELQAAITVAEDMLEHGVMLVTALNERSLRWRDKQ